ncbi:MAG: diacylglycerol/lipid kinase family protein [Spirochaetota bacterium]
MLSALEYHLERTLRSTALYPDRMVTVDVIINLQAGRLSDAKRASATLEELDALTRGLVAPERGPESLKVRFHQTHYVGHAREIARELLAEPVQGAHLLVSAGGDGTHGEVLGALAGDRSTRAGEGDLAFVRLPFGTGNDGADAPDLPTAVRLLLGSAELRRTGRLVVRPAGMSEFSGYNIASIGLDAYVAYLTNRLKGRFTGDLYKLLADVMTLFYERVVGAGRMRAEIIDDRGRPGGLEGEFLLFAVGVSGYRQYGGGKLVMPGYENLCAIESLGLLGKLRLKSLFYRGEHIHEPNVSMRAVTRAIVHYERSIPLQIDGETVWLHAENFPLEFQVLPPEVPVLVYDPRAAQSKV